MEIDKYNIKELMEFSCQFKNFNKLLLGVMWDV